MQESRAPYRWSKGAGSNKERNCFTRLLVIRGHNIILSGEIKDWMMCLPCQASVCDYIGPVCGCGTLDCVDQENKNV